MKKILSLLFIVLILVGCGKKDTSEGIMYVLPSEGENRIKLDDENQAKIDTLSSVITLENSDLKALDVDLNEIGDYLVDTNGEKVSLEGTTFIEVVATWCTYCKEQAVENNPILVEKYKDYNFVQLFIEQEEDIETYYKNLEIEVPKADNFHIIEKNDELATLIKEKTALQYFPTNLVLVDGVVKLMFTGECDEEMADLIAKYLENPVSDVELTEIIVRNTENVKADIGEEAVMKLQELEDEGNYATVDVTLNNIGKYVGDINPFKTNVLFVNYLENTEFNDLVRVFKERNPDVEVLLWTQDATSEDELPSIADVIQYNKENVPSSFKTELNGEVLPVAFYFENAICTGAISSPSALSTLNKGLELFIGENSIARIG